ncbi:MAG: hypothetical protein ABEJ59_03635 [Halanaeroarchaeum sp.]
MKRTVPLAATALLVLASTVGAVGLVAAAPAGGGQDAMAAETPTTNTTTTNTSNTSDGGTSIAPGARLAGVVGAQQAEYEAEVQIRALGVAVGAARTNGSKAQILANYTERIRTRIQTLQDRSDRLEAAYDNGSISEGVYAGQSTALTARIRSLERLANRTREHARAVPEEDLRANGVNATELESFQQTTKTMVSPRAAAAAERVAGSDVGHPVGPPEDVPGHDESGPGQSEGDRGQSTSDHGQSEGDHGNVGMGVGDAIENATNATTVMPGNDHPGDGAGDAADGAANQSARANITVGPPDESNGTAVVPSDNETTAPGQSGDHRQDGDTALGPLDAITSTVQRLFG